MDRNAKFTSRFRDLVEVRCPRHAEEIVTELATMSGSGDPTLISLDRLVARYGGLPFSVYCRVRGVGPCTLQDIADLCFKRLGVPFVVTSANGRRAV